MTDGLYPTPTRVTFLAAVRDGEVWEITPGTVVYAEDLELSLLVHGRCTERAREAQAAGWAEPGPAASHTTSRRWQLTAAGTAILSTAEARRRCPGCRNTAEPDPFGRCAGCGQQRVNIT